MPQDEHSLRELPCSEQKPYGRGGHGADNGQQLDREQETTTASAEQKTADPSPRMPTELSATPYTMPTAYLSCTNRTAKAHDSQNRLCPGISDKPRCNAVRLRWRCSTGSPNSLTGHPCANTGTGSLTNLYPAPSPHSTTACYISTDIHACTELNADIGTDSDAHAHSYTYANAGANTHPDTNGKLTESRCRNLDLPAHYGRQLPAFCWYNQSTRAASGIHAGR